MLPAALPHLREADIVRLCGLARAARGQGYARTGHVRDPQREAGTLRATVLEGETARAVRARFAEAGLDAWECECGREPPNQTASGLGQPCEHVAALLSLWVREPAQFRVVERAASSAAVQAETRRRPASAPEVEPAPLSSQTPAILPTPPLADLTHLDGELRRFLNLLALAGGQVTTHEAQRLFARLELGEPEAALAALEALQQLGFVQPLFATPHTSRPPAAVEGIAGWSIPDAVQAFLPREVTLEPLPEALSPGQQEPPPERDLPALLLLVAAKAVEHSTPISVSAARPQPASRSRLDLDAALAQQWSPLLKASSEQIGFCLVLLRLAGVLPSKSPGRVSDQRQADASLLEVSSEQARETLLRAHRFLLGRSKTGGVRDLFTQWLHAPDARELIELRVAGVRVAWQNQRESRQTLTIATENQAARQFITGLLRWVPAGRWWSFSSFVEFVWRFQPGFLRGHQQTFVRPQWWLERLPDGASLSMDVRAEWRQAEGRYIALLMRRALHWLGAVDLALDEQGRLKGFRVTSLGVVLLGAAPAGDVAEDEAAPAPAAAMPGALQLEEDGILLLPLDTLQLEQMETWLWWCEPAGATAAALRFRPTAERTAAALDAGQDVAAWLAWLEHLPQSEARAMLLAQVRQWAALYGQVRLYPSVTLLEVADQALLGELEAAPDVSARFIDHSLAPGLAVVRADASAPLVEEMQRRGYTPWITEHEAIDRS